MPLFIDSHKPLRPNGFTISTSHVLSLIFTFVLCDKGQIKDKFSPGFGNATLQRHCHSFARSSLGLRKGVGVDIQRCGGLGVAQGSAHRPCVRPAGNQQCSIQVPLWHNKDKSENPCVARSWRFVLILFPLKTTLKSGLREGVINQGCT